MKNFFLGPTLLGILLLSLPVLGMEEDFKNTDTHSSTTTLLTLSAAPEIEEDVRSYGAEIGIKYTDAQAFEACKSKVLSLFREVSLVLNLLNSFFDTSAVLENNPASLYVLSNFLEKNYSFYNEPSRMVVRRLEYTLGLLYGSHKVGACYFIADDPAHSSKTAEELMVFVSSLLKETTLVESLWLHASHFRPLLEFTSEAAKVLGEGVGASSLRSIKFQCVSMNNPGSLFQFLNGARENKHLESIDLSHKGNKFTYDGINNLIAQMTSPLKFQLIFSTILLKMSSPPTLHQKELNDELKFNLKSHFGKNVHFDKY